MNYKRCTEVPGSNIHQAFLNGYADYAVPMNLALDPFFERFFGPEGNRLEDSFVAIENREPVGLILGGIRNFDGYKNLRCGTLCVKPEHRGKGVSQDLFQLFLQNGMDQDCNRFSLEVLTDNDRAIRFYEKLGYEKINKLLYFSNSLDSNLLKDDKVADVMIKEVELSVAADTRKYLASTHINWQNESDYFLNDHTAHCFAAFDGNQRIGMMVITEAGKIYFLYVIETERCKGIASYLLKHAINELKLKKLTISMPDNIDITDFLKKVGFKKDGIKQYEMFKLV